ncbi:LOW QUALITY PROTEIN: uncharacterized protein LOC112563469 [Pomacea canaliculata]|uniref:LOW QUALITY PROTEIN: uncharacterized protein LOC112563469 n=1 Tax=Pomacea canaliculata TaxID=400727 RepID=UPI000D735C2D|nr:LOW QUALITY PROTEIN: uncharacterized protein LOC112563469 [Pomacea canaliculata]
MEIAVAEQDLSMLAEYNLTMDQLLTSSGLYADSRWFEPSTEICIVVAFCAAVGMGLLGNALVGLVLLRKGNLRAAQLVRDEPGPVRPAHLRALHPFHAAAPDQEELASRGGAVPRGPDAATDPRLRLHLTILCIAVDRYCAIVCTARTRPSQQAHARLVIPAVWLLSLALSTPLALTHRLQHVRNLTGDVLLTLCVEHWESDALLGVYTVCVLLFQYVLPGATVAALHLLICRFLRTHTHLPCEAKGQPPEAASPSQKHGAVERHLSSPSPWSGCPSPSSISSPTSTTPSSGLPSSFASSTPCACCSRLSLSSSTPSCTVCSTPTSGKVCAAAAVVVLLLLVVVVVAGATHGAAAGSRRYSLPRPSRLSHRIGGQRQPRTVVVKRQLGLNNK